MTEWPRLIPVILVLVTSVWCQESVVLTPPYFNIAQNRKITVNATCGEGVAQKEVYCKLVGYDRLDVSINKYDILDGQICDYCYAPSENGTAEKTHPGGNAVDGDTTTWWQSPPISRGLKYNRVTLTIDLVQSFQVAYVVVTMANSPRPGVWALERSVDHGQTWQPWQFFAGNDAECQKYFGMHADEQIYQDDQVICSTEFSKVLPIEDGEIYVSLTAGRPSAKDPLGSDTLRKWILANYIRLRLISTKTMLGHLMSVAQGDKTVTRRYYYSIKEISVGGRCVCNGHAYVCPPSETDPDLLVCQCQHNTAGPNCEQCAPGFVQKKWRRYTRKDPYECEPCNCNGHSDKCHYDDEVDRKAMSMDINGRYEGGGVCDECQHFTSGINCETCVSGYFRPEGVLPNATEPCIPCRCSSDHRYTGNCAPESGKCECKPAFSGREDCSACADGYYDYPECKPCDCFANGTQLMNNGMPFCVADGASEVQCPCLENFSGPFCSECAEGYYNFPECEPCQCNPTGSLSPVCDREQGQCPCQRNYGSRRCDSCQNGFYDYPTCKACDCNPEGTEEEVCDKMSGRCICKEGFGGSRCDRCEPGWFDYPTCTPCMCSEVGSGSTVCDSTTGQCKCYNNFGGRQCAECSSGYYSFPECKACLCDSLGSRGLSCDDNGNCNCRRNFIGQKCTTCAPERYNFPLCEECNCNPDGVTPDFFAKGGCANVPAGSLCTCKKNVVGRICDACKPLFWNLQSWIQDGCEECNCNPNGTIGSIGVCDPNDGRCPCKPNVGGSRTCDLCLDGFYALSGSDGLGCTPCLCDIGGTDMHRGETAICDKESGQCRCRSGMVGRQCDDVQPTYYVPTLYQFQSEIEDGYRVDGSPVRIGYDDNRFPSYSWRGYGTYSQLQDEVLLDVPLDRPSVYRMVIRYINPNDEPATGTVVVKRADVESGRDPVTRHQLILPPTQGQPQFITVSGDKGTASPFDLEAGIWTTALKIKNDDPESQEVLVDYFVFLPNEYYESSILKDDVQSPCIAEKSVPYCRQLSYPDLPALRSFANQAQRPGGGPDVYSWSDNLNVLSELGSPKLATLARWQPELVFPLNLDSPGPHVLVLSYFTPAELPTNATNSIAVSIGDGEDDPDYQVGQASVYNCPYSTLCRQVVIEPDGRVAVFNLKKDPVNVHLKNDNHDLNMAVDSVSAVPLEDWSLDYVTPTTECIKKDGVCVSATFPDAPDESTVISLGSSNEDSKSSPFYLDEEHPMEVIQGRVPRPGPYVLVAHYYQPNSPGFDLNLNVSYANVGEDTDMPTLVAEGRYHPTILPVAHCKFNSGCRAVLQMATDDKNPHFHLSDEFFVSGDKVNSPVWLESIAAIPSNSFKEDYLQPEKFDKRTDFAVKCGQGHFNIDPDLDGECRSAVISVASEFNNGALECNCDMTGSTGYECSKIGGQCPCKPNVIGRQCTRCRPGFFGYPDCKQCNCPPTAQCNEDTGECICAPHVTGTEDNPCSQCEENTFGYDPITGCQECMCEVMGTINYNTSCSLDSGACYCKENVVGRTCDHCSAGSYSYPHCAPCQCSLQGTTQDICNQETSECLCKTNVEGRECDQCKEGTFDLKESNPDGCQDCFCFGKTTFCSSHDGLIRTKIASMNNWKLTSFKIGRTIAERKLRPEDLSNYSGELAVSFSSYPGIDFTTHAAYFKAPEDYLRNQIKSYGGQLKYRVTYSGYELEGAPKYPDVLLIGADLSLLFYSERKIIPNTPMDISAPIDPYYWYLPSGARIDRSKMMVVLNNLKGVYIRGGYGLDANGQARLTAVELDSAEEIDPEKDYPIEAERVTSVELCQCPEGYYGYSCEDCALGYFRSQEGPLGPICMPCNCHGHSDTCHPLTGECVTLKPYELTSPEYEDEVSPLGTDESAQQICHFRPDLCIVDQSSKPCAHNTTGLQCDKCDVGFYGDATRGSAEDCQSCPCPLPENNFAVSCDALMSPRGPAEIYEGFCVCKEHYFGERCELCGPGYYGQPETIGDYCKPCECNDNIDVTDPDACDRYSGICWKCLGHTAGDNCERCENWYFGDGINAKNCRECSCNKTGTESCDHRTGECTCLPGVEGQICNICKPNMWGFDSGAPGCTQCDCSEASESTQCDLITGQCKCKNGVTGQKCDRCMAGFWNLGPDGCESCGCNTEFAVGGTCDQVTGQCSCLEGVIGQNCDHCPEHWVLVVNETRTYVEWKRPFDYVEGCFPCSSCVRDLLEMTGSLRSDLDPIMKEFKGVESSYFEFKRLQFIEKEVDRLMPEIELLNPLEGYKRLTPLEQHVTNHQTKVKSLNVDFKLKVMSDQNDESSSLQKSAIESVHDMEKVGAKISADIQDMQTIADGLGSGVTPKQIEASVDLGRAWLEEMKSHDFSDDRLHALEKKNQANEVMKSAKAFASPVERFKMNVTESEKMMESLRNRLESLKNYSEAAQQMIKVASTLNFRNSEPAAVNKLSKISAMNEGSQGNVKLGAELIGEANQFLQEAQEAFNSLQGSNDIMAADLEQYKNKVMKDRASLEGINDQLYEAQNHAQKLDHQAMQLQNILENAKMPASQALQAANAYDMIMKALENSTDAADKAISAAENSATMSVGVVNKAVQSENRTQGLYDAATKAKKDLDDGLDRSLQSMLLDVDDLTKKNKVTKDAVEKVAKNLDSIENLGEDLKSTLTNADDAETLAHDALTSIDARAVEIKKHMKNAKKIQDQHAEMKLSMDATKKALNDLENRSRPKRDTETITEDDMNSRLGMLRDSQKRIAQLKESVAKMMTTVKKRVSEARKAISNIETGMSFTQGSFLKLRNPSNIVYLSAQTKFSFHFNVSRHSTGDGRAFLFYIGNEENTHTRTPFTFTDDFIAVEVTEFGKVKLTVEMGAGPFEILSNAPVEYGQWHELVVDRRAHLISMILRFEVAAGDVIEDPVLDVPLPRYNEQKRTIGTVFNLHQEYSSIFVGGFPNYAKIQESVRETFMEGQIEDLVIGTVPVSLWNFKASNKIRGSPERNKLKERPKRGLRFEGQGYLSIDRSNYADIEREFNIKLKFKPMSMNGLIMIGGDADEREFISLELQNQHVVYSFNLGDGVTSVKSAKTYSLNEWHLAEISRQGRVGVLRVDGLEVGEIISNGASEALTVDQHLYFGGYPGTVTPFGSGQVSNYTGCLDDIYLGPDKIQTPESQAESVGVFAGCEAESITMATFHASTPGYIQLESIKLKGTFEVTMMFRSAQERGILFYVYDFPNNFFYISLSLIRGALQLNVFPRHEIITEKSGDKATQFNDNKWHTVNVIVSETSIEMLIDDYASFKVGVEGMNDRPMLTDRYNVIVGGIPESINLVSGAVASNAPFIGCIRDVLISEAQSVADFRTALYQTGATLNQCASSTTSTTGTDQGEDDDGSLSGSSAPGGQTGQAESKSADTDGEDNEEFSSTGFTEQTSDIWGIPDQKSQLFNQAYGDCKLPILPAQDPDVDKSSGLRFGTQKDTYLEFDRVLRIKKSSDFGIEFRTKDKDGIIFYVADDDHSDFLTLFMKNGKMVYGFNCGSGSAYIETEEKWDDGEWHFAEFSRHGSVGKLLIDGNVRGETEAYGATKNIEVSNNFFLGGLSPEFLENDAMLRNVQKVDVGFIGCLRNFRLRDKQIGKWSKNNRGGVIPCSNKVEPGYFFGPGGGFVHAFKRFRVGLDFDITMQIKPRNISGLLLAIQGRRDYLILQMVDGTMSFTVDNGRGPITAVFKPTANFQFCDGKWHEIHAVKAKNVVTLSVDEVFAQPGIGVPGVSSTDTNHGLFIGGHPKLNRLTGLQTQSNYVGCIRKIVVENQQVDIDSKLVKGDVLAHACPTI